MLSLMQKSSFAVFYQMNSVSTEAFGPHFDLSVFESTAYLKFAKLQYAFSGFRCRVITGSLMRLY